MTTTDKPEVQLKPSSVEVNNVLHLLNLNRPDIAALPNGARLSYSLEVLRMAEDIIKRYRNCDNDILKWAEANPDAVEALLAGLAAVYAPLTSDVPLCEEVHTFDSGGYRRLCKPHNPNEEGR